MAAIFCPFFSSCPPRLYSQSLRACSDLDFRQFAVFQKPVELIIGQFQIDGRQLLKPLQILHINVGLVFLFETEHHDNAFPLLHRHDRPGSPSLSLSFSSKAEFMHASAEVGIRLSIVRLPKDCVGGSINGLLAKMRRRLFVCLIASVGFWAGSFAIFQV